MSICDNSVCDMCNCDMVICDKILGCDFNIPVLHKFNITENDIEDSRKIRPNLTMGINSIPIFIVPDCISCLAKPLC